jgi:hypothetical protein
MYRVYDGTAEKGIVGTVAPGLFAHEGRCWPPLVPLSAPDQSSSPDVGYSPRTFSTRRLIPLVVRYTFRRTTRLPYDVGPPLAAWTLPRVPGGSVELASEGLTTSHQNVVGVVVGLSSTLFTASVTNAWRCPASGVPTSS